MSVFLSLLVVVSLVAMHYGAHGARNRQCIPGDVDSVCGCGDPGDTEENCFAESPGIVRVMDGYTICDLDDSTAICNTDAPEGWISNSYSFVSPSLSSSVSTSESSCCVPCTKTDLDCPESSLAFATGPGAGLCAVVSGEPAEGFPVVIDEWQVIGSVTGAPPDLTTAWGGSFEVNAYAALGGVISKFDIRRNGASVQLFRTDDCIYTLQFAVGQRKRQQSSGSVTILGGPAQLGVNGGALADPHLRSPTGVKYDFDGQANGIYALFVAPQFQVNMLLAAHGPATRYMTKIGIVFGNLTLKFDAHLVLPAAQRARLVALGGRAFSRRAFSLTLELCGGHEVTLSAHHTKSAPIMNYLNVDVITPGCLDAFDGALGQTFTCKHVAEDVPFVWDHAQEESFRVPSLTHRSGAGEATNAPACGSTTAAFEGQSSMLGSLNH